MLRALRINLRVRKYDVTTAATGREALIEAGRRPPDAVILDLGLPDVDGIEVIRRLRGWSHAPVIVLSGRTGPGDKIAALDAGADDYVTKPFSMEELLARLRAAFRRDDTGLPLARVKVGRCQIDLAAHTALEGTTRYGSRPTQWRLLEILLRHPGQLVTTQRLLDRDLGTRIRALRPLPALPHGRAAPQAGGRPVKAPPPADRARDGLPLPAVAPCLFFPGCSLVRSWRPSPPSSRWPGTPPALRRVGGTTDGRHADLSWHGTGRPAGHLARGGRAARHLPGQPEGRPALEALARPGTLV